MSILDFLNINNGIKAIIWDMDGPIIDSLQFDREVCSKIASTITKTQITLDPASIAQHFALAGPEFWANILADANIKANAELVDAALAQWEVLRIEETMPLQTGFSELFQTLKAKGFNQALASNNKREDIIAILNKLGLESEFTHILGYDTVKGNKKPAPDIYIAACENLALQPEQCLVIEDSIVGGLAAAGAGCPVIGIACGGDSLNDLENLGVFECILQSYKPNKLTFIEGKPTQKTLKSPNDFISHMVEHIAWRSNTGIDMDWQSTDWRVLGEAIGTHYRPLSNQEKAEAIGVIDDGIARVQITRKQDQTSTLNLHSQLDVDWMLKQRCEQLDDALPLTDLLSGFAQSMGANIDIEILTFNDPHHTWEGVFRGIGICLNQLCATTSPTSFFDIFNPADEKTVYSKFEQGEGYSTFERDGTTFSGIRATSETYVGVTLRPKKVNERSQIKIQSGANLTENQVLDVLEHMLQHTPFIISVDYKDLRLVSSHVLFEDIGMTFGKVLFYVLLEAMQICGAECYGNHINAETGTGTFVSLEGRKFFEIVPNDQDKHAFNKRSLIGQNSFDNVRCEDLDDFIDGFVGGLTASIGLIEGKSDAANLWRNTFEGLGYCIAQTLNINEAKKGVTPGVKATLI